MLRSFKQNQRVSAMGADTIQNAVSPKSQRSRSDICMNVAGVYAQEAGAIPSRWRTMPDLDLDGDVVKTIKY